MHPIIYDVAVSIDGYISGPDGDISSFPQEGPVVDDYLERLAGYSTAIMGKATYEFGYRFGMKPGENPYPHMRTIVFSETLELGGISDVEARGYADGEAVARIRDEANGPVYLVGGGAFAASLLGFGLIDRLRLKRAPIVLGGGTRMLEHAVSPAELSHIETREYPGGYVFQEFAIG
ncbi:dihydrofolate reductase family protein [Altererythrobacter sp. MF3-039]|uniref:dihydrofolate reductase family protein n=1 Tax=Altererythrobacter sp. MF3-039 TaxID=3252901 RepID=UPI00390CCE13